MIQFYSPDIKETRELGAEDSAHCVRVLRKGSGDRIFVVDGKGTRYECEILLASPKKVSVEILAEERIEPNWDSRIELYVAPTKNGDRLEWLVEKGVEIGVDRIVPLICERSERRHQKTERLQKIAVSAMKQSLKATLPEILEPVKFRDLMKEEFEGEWVMGYCNEEVERVRFCDVYDPHRPVRILIGPEGDFSPSEVEMAFGRGVKGVTFGRERLRTETAALAAVHSAQLMQEMSAGK